MKVSRRDGINYVYDGQHTGTFLLNELERREQGKEIYLFTDDSCTYQFYEHRGFERVCEKDIVLKLPEKNAPMKCLLYRKKMGTIGQ